MCRARVVHQRPPRDSLQRTTTPCDALPLPRGLSGEQVSCERLPCARLSKEGALSRFPGGGVRVSPKLVLYLFLCFFRFWLYFLKPHCISEHEVVHLSVEPLFLGSSIDGACVLWLKFAVARKKAAVLAACAYRKET